MITLQDSNRGTLIATHIPFVVQQHAEDAVVLFNIRSFLVVAPHVRLRHLRRLDDRVAAHLDGLAVGARHGEALTSASLQSPCNPWGQVSILFS